LFTSYLELNNARPYADDARPAGRDDAMHRGAREAPEMHKSICVFLLSASMQAAMLVEVPATTYSSLTTAGDSIAVYPASLLVTNGGLFAPLTLTVDFTLGPTLDPRPENSIPLLFSLIFDGVAVSFPAAATFWPDAGGTQVRGSLNLLSLGSLMATGDPGSTAQVSGIIAVPVPEPSGYGLAGVALLLLFRKCRSQRRLQHLGQLVRG
jgi:hypothetical protein